MFKNRNSSGKTKIILMMALLFIFTLLTVSMNCTEEEVRANGLSDQNIEMVYVDTPVREVLRSLARLSGENIVFDETVEGDITLELESVSLRTAMDKILSVKDLDYYIQEDIMIVASPERIDELYREVERKIYTLDHAGTEEAANLVGELLPQVDVDPLPDQRRLILSGLPDDLIEAEEILNDVDQPTPHESQVFDLENVSPEEAAAEIENIFPEIIVSPRQAYDDIIVRGHIDELSEVEKLIADIDTPRSEIRETYLPAHLEPEELKRRLDDMYPGEELRAEVSDGIVVLEGRPYAVEEATNVLADIEEVEEDMVETSVRLNYVDVEEMAEIISDLEEGVSLQTSTERSTLLLQGSESRVQRVKNAIQELDQPRRQVLLEVHVEEVSHDVLEEKGINPDELRDFASIGLDYDDYRPTGFDIEDEDMPGPFEFFEEDGAAETLANPSLLTMDGEEAELEIVTDVPYREEVDVDNGRDVSWDYEEVGVTLKFNPTITEEDTINLHMEPEVSTMVEIPAPEAPPETRARRFENTVQLHDGQTFAVGGLIQEEERHNVSQIPYLGDLPLLGRLFSYEEIEEEQTEILFFIEAHIVDIMEDELDLEEIDPDEFEDIGGDFRIHSDPYEGMREDLERETPPEEEIEEPEVDEPLPEKDVEEDKDSFSERVDTALDDFMSRYEDEDEINEEMIEADEVETELAVKDFAAPGRAEQNEDITASVEGTVENQGDSEETVRIEIRYYDPVYTEETLYNMVRVIEAGDSYNIQDDLRPGDVVIPEDAQTGERTLKLWLPEDEKSLTINIEEEINLED